MLQQPQPVSHGSSGGYRKGGTKTFLTSHQAGRWPSPRWHAPDRDTQASHKAPSFPQRSPPLLPGLTGTHTTYGPPSTPTPSWHKRQSCNQARRAFHGSWQHWIATQSSVQSQGSRLLRKAFFFLKQNGVQHHLTLSGVPHRQERGVAGSILHHFPAPLPAAVSLEPGGCPQGRAGGHSLPAAPPRQNATSSQQL